MERDRPPPVPTRSESLRSDHGSPLLTPRSPSSGSLSIRKDLLPDRLLGSPRGQLGRHKLHADPMGRSLSPRRQARGENGARRGSFERQTRLDADAGKYKSVIRLDSLIVPCTVSLAVTKANRAGMLCLQTELCELCTYIPML